MRKSLPQRWILLCLLLVSATLFFTGWLSLSAASAEQAESGISISSPNAADSILVVSLPTNDIVYNPAEEKIYASVPGSTIGIGNTVTAVSPRTGEIANSVFVGSEPNKLALATDNRSLYVALDGAFAVRRFDTQTQTALPQFDVGYDPADGPFYAKEIAVSPDNPDTVAVVRQQFNFIRSLAIYNNGVQLPNVVNELSVIAFSNTGSTLYGSTGSNLQTITANSGGATVVNTTPLFGGFSEMEHENGTIITSSGHVIDAATRTLLGTFPNASSSAFVPDTAVGRSYYILRDPLNNNNVILKAFSNTTFTSMGSLTISNVPGSVTSLVKWGTNGLAFRTSNGKLIIVQTSLRPTANPMPTPSVTPTPTPAPTPHALSIRTYDLTINDFVYSRTQNSLYVSVPSTAGVPNGNSVAKLNTTTGQIQSPVFVGSEPTRLAVSDDQNTLYAALEGSNSVRKVDLVTGQAGLTFPAGAAATGSVYDMDVLPGSPNAVAVSKYPSGTTIYDSGVPRPDRVAANLYIEFSGPTELYSVSDQVNRIGVTGSGLTQLSTYRARMFGEVEADSGFLYSSNGRVFDTATQKLSGSLFGTGFDNALTVEREKNRAYAITIESSNCNIRAYELDTYRLAGSISIPCIQSLQRRLLRWGTNGLAFRANNRVYLVQSSLVGSGPVPTPTPTGTPTPTPTPVYIPTFVRTVDVPTNDLVYNQATNSIVASIPNSGGATLGNTLTHIDPLTGAVTASVPVGTDPNKLAASDDGQTLYTTLDGPGAVRRYNIQTQTPGEQFALPVGFTQPYDIDVMPGSPSTVAIAGFTNGAGVFDNGIKRPGGSVSGLAYSINTIAFSSDPNIFYGYDNYSSGHDLIKFTAAESVTGVRLPSGLIGGSVHIKYHNGLLYSSGGTVADPVTERLLGRFQGGGSSFTIDAATNRIFFVSGDQITAYDLATYVPIGSITIPLAGANPTSLTRWGTNGLAFRTASTSQDNPSRIFLVQSNLVAVAGPMPTGFRFASGNQSYGELETSMNVQVTRSGDVSGTSTVNYSTTGVTATPGQDFTAQNGTVTFNPGETVKSITLPMINDTIYEGTESFTISLSGAGGSEVILAPNSKTITIFDSDSRPRISNTSMTVAEPRTGTATAASLEIRLSNPSVETISVSYSTVNGTAAAGADYVSANGIITFGPMETVKAIPLTIRADNVDEGNETFFVNLSAPINSSIQVSQGVVTIQNTDTRAALFDYDGDGRSDLSVRRPADNIWYLLRSTTGYTGQQFGEAGDGMAPADYDGDLKADVAVFRPSNGTWYMIMSQSQTFQAFGWGADGDLPVPTDRDGDRKADLVLFRPSNNTWYTRFANGTFAATVFGEAGDKPMLGDFDGDGIGDIALFRPSDNNWYIVKSSLGFFVQTWGEAGDIPVTGDFDGDGATDQAVFRPSTGQWFLSRTTAGFSSQNWGEAGDIPVAADYDGDSKADVAVFRPSNGTWYIVGSLSGQAVQQFGQNGDVPTQSSFIY